MEYTIFKTFIGNVRPYRWELAHYYIMLEIELSAKDLNEIQTAVAQTEIQGARYPQHFQNFVNR